MKNAPGGQKNGPREKPQASTQPEVERFEANEPHYKGHRSRLRERFAESSDQGMPDYELLELVLFRSIPQRDVKPLAKALVARFGSFAEVIGARQERLTEVEGIGAATALDLKIVEAAARAPRPGGHWRSSAARIMERCARLLSHSNGLCGS